MADFCKECSIQHWNDDTQDLRRMEKGLYNSLCEGCGGFIVHDETGLRDKSYPILDVITGEPLTNTKEPQ